MILTHSFQLGLILFHSNVYWLCVVGLNVLNIVGVVLVTHDITECIGPEETVSSNVSIRTFELSC